MKPFFAYANDRQDAAASGPAFARGLLKLSEILGGTTPIEACDHNVHLLAHSMGNYALRHTVREYVAQSTGRPARLFHQIFFVTKRLRDAVAQVVKPSIGFGQFFLPAVGGKRLGNGD